MNRRQAVRSLFCGSALASTPAIASVPEIPKPAAISLHDINLRDRETNIVDVPGFRLSWTGWKESATSIDICGQWIATSTSGLLMYNNRHSRASDSAYSCSDGQVGLYFPGMHFDVNGYGVGGHLRTHVSQPRDLEESRSRSRKILEIYIAHGSNPPPTCPLCATPISESEQNLEEIRKNFWEMDKYRYNGGWNYIPHLACARKNGLL